MPTSLRHQHLKSLLWGKPEGPSAATDLPEALRPVAAAADDIGRRLARARVLYYEDPVRQGDPVVQVQVLANVLADLVLPEDGARVPDENTVWTRRDLEGDAFDADALDDAVRFLAAGGEPNVWARDMDARPALRDVRAMQLIAREIVDVGSVADEVVLPPSRLIEDFVRLHWSNQDGERGLEFGWEEHPLGQACFAAVRRTLHLPVEEAEWNAPERQPQAPDEPWRRSI